MVLGILLLRAPDLAAQTEAETQRATLTGLRSFGIHASVQRYLWIRYGMDAG